MANAKRFDFRLLASKGPRGSACCFPPLVGNMLYLFCQPLPTTLMSFASFVRYGALDRVAKRLREEIVKKCLDSTLPRRLTERSMGKESTQNPNIMYSMTPAHDPKPAE